MKKGVHYPELDVLRALSVFLMLLAHSTNYLFFGAFDGMSTTAKALHFIGNVAPVGFFFCVGLTIDNLYRKPAQRQLRQLSLLLYVALIHNLLMSELVFMDFFFFICLSQIILLILRRAYAGNGIYLACIMVGVAVLASPLSNAVQGFFFAYIPGPFTFFPWVLYVLSGALYARYIEARDGPEEDGAGAWSGWGWVIAIGLLALGLAMARLAPAWQVANWGITKFPLTAPYFMVTLGSILLVLELARWGRRFYADGWFFRTYIQEVSKHLLLATVSHYLPLVLFLGLAYYQPWFAATGFKALFASHDQLAILVVSCVAYVFVRYWVQWLHAWWRRVGSATQRKLLGNVDLFALAAVLGCSFLNYAGLHTFEYSTSGFVFNYLVSIAWMSWFALAMTGETSAPAARQ